MDKFNSDRLLYSLLEQDSIQVINWLEHVLTKRQKVSESFNWLTLADASTFKARSISSYSQKERLGWAKIATLIYEFLAGTKLEVIADNSYIYSSMMLRIYMIKTCGDIPNDRILDGRFIENWFFKTLIFTHEEVLKKIELVNQFLSGNLPELKNDNENYTLLLNDLRKLRTLKQRLRIIEALSKVSKIQDKRLWEWLSIRDKLP